MESKIIKGKFSERAEYNSIASLQVDGKHICSSGLFKKGFLLTAGECAIYIEDCAVLEKQKATAVIGDMHLNKGKRIDIVGYAHFTKHGVYDNDIGVIMVGWMKKH